MAKSYFSKVPGFYRSSYRRCSVKNVFRKKFAKFTRKHLCLRLILIKLHAYGCKKETPAQVFSCEFGEISKSTFFTEHLRTNAFVFSFSEAATGGVLWKKVFLKIKQNSQENTCGLRKFSRASFLSLDDCFWLFPATWLKWAC